MRQKGFYERYGKRFIDIALCSIAIVALFPMMLVVALIIRILLGSPVLFFQERPGKDEKIFRIYKFRTMNEKRNKDGELLPDWQRLTNLGRFLRKTSIDELPELFCIIKGDMSIVGPRPLSKLYLPYYTKEEKKRHQVRPGLSGLAQIHGRNYLSWEERFTLDIAYIENISFWGDISIIWKTIGRAIKGTDVDISGDYSMVDFDDYRKGMTDANGCNCNGSDSSGLHTI